MRYLYQIPRIIPALLIILIFTGTAAAQMFSVGSAPQADRSPDPLNSLTLNYVFADFSYFDNVTPDVPEVLYDFNGPLYRVQYENPLLNVYGMIGSSLGEDNAVRVAGIGVQLSAYLPIYMRPRFRALLPAMLSTDYLLIRTSETAGTNQEFAQNTGYIGTGLQFDIRARENLRLQSKSLASIGYMVGTFGSDGGVSYKFEQQIRIFIDRLFGNAGLALGTDLRYIRYNSNNDNFMYDLQQISVVAGVTF